MSKQEIDFTINIPDTLVGSRVDVALASLLPDYSRARIQSWIKQGDVTCLGKALRAKDKLDFDQVIEIHTNIPLEERWEAQAIDLDIVFEDESILVINKPPGLVVHPGAGNPDQTLVNALLHYDPDLAQCPRAGIVHRLDKDTSGLMVVARTITVHNYLVKAIQARDIKREYQALVYGNIISGNTIETDMGRDPRHRTKMAVVGQGKPAVTHYRVLQRFTHFTLLKVSLETGRTHQIRVHLSHIKHPIVGDPVYGGRLRMPSGSSEILREALRNFKRQALHAWRLELPHPRSGDILSLEADMPKDMSELIDLLSHNEK